MLTRKSNTDKYSPWIAEAPFLRLIHCIFDIDANKLKFQMSQNQPTRAEIDGRHNDETRMRDVWVDVVETFNDETFNPKSNIFTHLHPNYEQSIDISYRAIEHVMKLLYLWEYAEKNGILHCVLQRIEKNLAYDTEPPKTTATRDVLRNGVR